MNDAAKVGFTTPKIGQTPLKNLRAGSRSLVPEDYAFGSEVSLLQLSNETLDHLEGLSLSTQEELLGYLEVPEVGSSAIGNLLESQDQVTQLKERLTATSNKDILLGFEKVRHEDYSFGALLPAFAFEPPTAEPPEATTEAEQPTGVNHIISGSCLPPIKDQGRRGTCVAFATCAVLEYGYCVRQQRTLDLCEQFQFWHCKQYDKNPAADGTWPNVSFALVGAHGICDEAEWVYNPLPLPGNIAQDPPGPSARIDPRPPNVPTAPFNKVSAALTIAPATDVAKIQGYISADSAVAIAIPVFNSWAANPYTRLTGNIPMPLPGEPRTGGHAVVLIGWAIDSSFAGGGYFVVRNSWGTRWGTTSPFGAGHGTIPFDFIRLYNQFAHTVKI